jgi:hypothetical protein
VVRIGAAAVAPEGGITASRGSELLRQLRQELELEVRVVGDSVGDEDIYPLAGLAGGG